MELFPIQLLILLVITNRYVLGWILRRLKGRRFDQTTDSYEPTVAFAVPLFNEGKGIYQTLLTLTDQEYPAGKLEVVVVDDCSTDDSYQWALKAAEDRPNLRVLRNAQNQGKRKSINTAVRATGAEVIISVDSDVLADKHAVRELVRRFTGPEVAAVGGRTYIFNRNETWLTRMIEVKFFYAQEYLKNIERTFRTVMCLSGCLTAYRRSVLMELEPILENRAVAGVPIRYGEDRYLTRQIVKAGYRTVYTTAAWCTTHAPPTLSTYFPQQLRWRRSNIIDFFAGLSHAWKLPPVVGIHYVSQLALMLAYPVIIIDNLLNGTFWEVMVLHLGFVAALGLLYRIETREVPEALKVPAYAFLPMAFVMPVSYLLLTPLAAMTLDSGSWETRGAPAAAPAQVPTPKAEAI